ncbi:hypothetical protein JMG10_02810 [Nostoc ellipsosporum NOK]|nr:hypothetical protein [Nostoc ellipsosporum NOK]
MILLFYMVNDLPLLGVAAGVIICMLVNLWLKRHLLRRKRYYKRKYEQSNNWCLQLEEQIETMQLDHAYIIQQLESLRRKLAATEKENTGGNASHSTDKHNSSAGE